MSAQVFDQERAYDPTGNPRWIDDEEMEREVRDLDLRDLQSELATLRQIQDTFNTDGWSHIAATLEKHREAFASRLLQGMSHNAQEDAYVRGELKRIEQTLAWPTKVAAGILSIRQEMEQHAAEESP